MAKIDTALFFFGGCFVYFVIKFNQSQQLKVKLIPSMFVCVWIEAKTT